MNKNNLITWTVLLVLLIFVWLIVFKYKKNLDTEYYSSLSQEEQENIKIDEYNFEQLEKVKRILDWLNNNSYTFDNLKEFNEKFNQNIEPIKNCYILSNESNFYLDSTIKWDYIFWFKFYSDTYIKKYNEEFYVYPESKYSRVGKWLCWKYGWICASDVAFWKFKWTITKGMINHSFYF